MSDVTTWIRAGLANRRKWIRLPLGEDVLGTVLHNILTERARPVVGDGTRTTEPSADNERAPSERLEDKQAAAIPCILGVIEPHAGLALLASEQRFPGVPFAEDGFLIVDPETGRVLETLQLVGQKTGPPTNGEILDNTGPPEYGRTTASDVSGSTSDLLHQARRRVEELANANRRKDEFLAMLGHELRNPLGSILDGIYLLGQQMQDAPASQKMQAMIERQVRGMTRLVDDLLDLSRITRGRLHLQRERIDLRDVVSNAIQTLESDIRQRNHRLSLSLPDTPVWLQADPGRLEQVFVNLLANASKYTDTGGELTVGGRIEDGLAVVLVRDTGIGIAPEVLPHLFDLFWQADATASRSKSGLGIGLALVRNLVESHGGIVTAQSAGLGQGSEFTVYLPMEV
jgi:signal transduction histidine kinase